MSKRQEKITTAAAGRRMHEKAMKHTSTPAKRMTLNETAHQDSARMPDVTHSYTGCRMI